MGFAQSAALQLRGCACCTALLLCCAELRFGVWIPGAGALLCCARDAWWIPPRRVAGFCAHGRSVHSARGGRPVLKEGEPADAQGGDGPPG